MNLTKAPIEIRRNQSVTSGWIVKDQNFLIGLDMPKNLDATNECNLADCFWFQEKKEGQKNNLMDELELEQIDRLVDTKSVVKRDDKKQKAVIEEMLDRSECPRQHLDTLRRILWKYRDTLAGTNDPVGLCTSYKPKIPLNMDEPVNTPQYPIPFKMREVMQESIQYFLKQGIIQPSNSPYNSPSLMVPKKDGGFRLVVDFRRTNR
jgi:hypothetical protein